MVFRDRSYSVLLVCGEGQFDIKVSSYLPYNEYYPVRKIHSLSEARRELLERSFDIVLVNWPSDAEGKKLALEAAEKGKSAVLLMADRSHYDDIYFDVVSFGVFCIPKQINGAEFAGAMRMVCSGVEKVLGEKKKQLSVSDKMAEIRLVNKAKWALIEKKGMSEDEAHKYVEKYAMDQRISKKEAAERILGGQA